MAILCSSVVTINRLAWDKAPSSSGVEMSYPCNCEGVEMNLGLPRDGYRTISHGRTKRFDVDLGRCSEHVDDTTGGVNYPSEHVRNLGGG